MRFPALLCLLWPPWPLWPLCTLCPLCLSSTGVILEGQVRAQTRPLVVAGKIVDKDGKAVAGTKVMLAQPEDRGLPVLLQDDEARFGTIVQTVSTDATGQFRFQIHQRSPMVLYVQDSASKMSALMPGVLPGDYKILHLQAARRIHGRCVDTRQGKGIAGLRLRVGIHPQGHAPPHLPRPPILSMTLATSPQGEYSLLVPEHSVVELRATYRNRPAHHRLHEDGSRDLLFDPGATGTIEGRVVGLGGKPIARALVQNLRHPRVRTLTDAEGRFKTALEPDGWLHVRAKGHAHKLYQASRRDLEIRLPAGLTLQARFVNRQGQALAGARVALAAIGSPGNSIESTSWFCSWEERLDRDGKLKVDCLAVARLVCGFIEVEDRCRWFYTGEPEQDLDLGEIRIQRPIQLEGRILAGDGAPAPGARIRALRLPASKKIRQKFLPLPHLEVLADRAGRFRLPGLLPGDYKLAFLTKGSPPRFITSKVTFETPALDISFAKGRTLEGQVLDQDSKPVPKAKVCLVLRTDTKVTSWTACFACRQPAVCETGRQGRYLFRGLPGDASFQVYAEGRIGGSLRHSQRRSISQKGEQSLTVDLVLLPLLLLLPLPLPRHKR